MIVHDTAHASTRFRLDAAITVAAPHLRPLLAAVRDADCNLGQVPQHVGRFDFPTGRPLIAMLLDDFDLSCGPTAFHHKCVRRLIKRCSATLIVSGAPDERLYTASAAVAVILRRDVLIVETQPRWEADWAALIQAAHPGVPTVIHTPKPAGGVH